MSSTRLRIGVALLIIWLVPLWILAPVLTRLAHLSSVAVGTAVIAIIQTVLGLLGLWLAGSQVRTIVRGRKLKQALSALWTVFIRGNLSPPTGGDEADKPTATQPD